MKITLGDVLLWQAGIVIRAAFVNVVVLVLFLALSGPAGTR